MSSCLYTVASCRPPCCVNVANGDVNERSLSRETGISSAEGERARLSFLRISFRKLTDVSKSLDDGGTSSAGSSSGISEPLSLR